jgi:electron transfer flavoprotein beta subunit
MKIIVCVKQVPDTADIKWSENNTIIREGVESIINPFDEFAIETALRIKDQNPKTHITVLTMGPPQAVEILKRAIAMGADDGILVSDRKFAGADTQATSRTLATTIKNMVKDFDLLICGQFAIDGDTAQTGPSIAQHLDLPQVTYVKD